MIPRMTTVGTLKNYRYDLNRSNNTMTKAMTTVMTERNFNSYAENPALATRCFQIRRSFMRTASQLTINDSILSKYNQAWSALDTVSQDIYDSTVFDDTVFGNVIRGENGADASARNALGQSLTAKAKTMIQTMNGRHGENYIFGGADTLNPPFTWGVRKNPSYVDPDILKAAVDDKTAVEKYPQTFQYIGDGTDGNLTNAEGSALKGVKINPNADFSKDSTDDNPWYLKDDGSTTKDIGEAALDLRENPDFITTDQATLDVLEAEFRATYDNDPDLENSVADYLNRISKPYLTEGGVPTDNTAGDAEKIIQKNPAYDKYYDKKYLTADGKGTDDESEAEQVLYFRGVPVDSDDPADKEKMEYFLNETKYLDVGLGHKEADGEAISSSVFNSALQGIYYLGGYGTDANGLPNNLITIIDRLGTILQRCDPDNGRYASDEEEAEANALIKKFEDQKDIFIQRYGEQDARTGFLRDNSALLTETADDLAEQFLGLEDVDAADAISAFMFARYSYDAALKLGNSILSQSLMDYLNL